MKGRTQLILEGLTQLVTLGVKVLGVIVAVNQLLIHPKTATPVGLAFSAFLIAGGQFSEGLLLDMWDRFLGSGGSSSQRDDPPPTPPKPPSKRTSVRVRKGDR